MPLTLAEAASLKADFARAIDRITSGSKPTVGQVVNATGAKFDPSNPTVKLQPRNWTGDDMRGRKFSECPAAFLRALSVMLDGFADKKENEPDPDPQTMKYAKWDRDNAQAARQWAAKLSGGGELFEKRGESADELADAGAF